VVDTFYQKLQGKNQMQFNVPRSVINNCHCTIYSVAGYSVGIGKLCKTCKLEEGAHPQTPADLLHAQMIATILPLSIIRGCSRVASEEKCECGLLKHEHPTSAEHILALQNRIIELQLKRQQEINQLMTAEKENEILKGILKKFPGLSEKAAPSSAGKPNE
jgi:hypothetical protein